MLYLINLAHQHSQFLGTVPDPGVWTVILLLLSCVGQQRALVPNGLFAVVKQQSMTFWWFKEKRIPKKLQITALSYHKISALRRITSGDGSL
jgi:hypothetical protein